MRNFLDILASYKNINLMLALAGVAALSFAYVAQYGFNLQPCPLCLWQRKPYVALIFFGVTGAILSCKKPTAALACILLGITALLTGLGISAFHTGVEQGWWTGLESCGDTRLPTGASLEELRNYLINRPIVDCRVPAWKMFGVSMTGYNFLLSLFLLGLAGVLTLRARERNHGLSSSVSQ